MQESQSIEWKWTWQDEYLKWLCGYANTDGGILYIGVNDDGYVVGVKDSKALLESLPNKINDKLGIIVSIKIYTERQGTNVRYGTAVPDKVSSKLVNQFACGLLSTNTLSKDDRRYEAVNRLEQETPVWLMSDGFMNYIETLNHKLLRR